MSEHWRQSTWGEEISLEYGKAIRGYDEIAAPIRVFGSNGPIGWTNTALAQGPGIILGRKGAYRGVHFSREPFFVIDTAYYVKPKSDLDMRWLYYAIIHHKLGEIDDGSPIPSTTRAAVYVEDVAIPTLPEQREIAAILGALDDKIELNRKTAAVLEEMARTLYRSWFVDFDPVWAKAEGRPPAHMDPTTAALFPDGFDDAGLPLGWRISPIGPELVILDSKRIPLSKSQREKRTGTIPYHGATSIMDYVDEAIFDEILLLVGEDGSVVRPDGKPFTQYIWGKSWVNNHAHVLKGARFSVEQLKCFFDQIDIAPFVNGAVQAKLNQGNLKNIPFVEAEANVHSAFDRIVSPWFASIRQCAEENQTLATLRDSLLPRLMSGELRVGAAREMLDEVA